MNTRRSSSIHTASKIIILLCLCWPQVIAEDNPSAEKVAQIQQEAKQGDADSQAQLADIYRYGKGVKIDYKESFQWASKAADQGHAQAQHYLGICYTYGMGVEKDPTAAFKWFQKSAEQGYTAAEYRLGICYLEGNGVARDNNIAVKWLLKAANQRDADAQFKLGNYYDELSIAEQENYESLESQIHRSRYGEEPAWQLKEHVEYRIHAYMWYNLASASGHHEAKLYLKKISSRMSPSEISGAQSRSSEWKPEP